ncbi:MAG: tetratricopeptide repeat protein [bacterium]|nr:tetratricopeptide repeat protein [bacterium]
MTPVLCQFCGIPNPHGQANCARCGNKLLVVSGLREEDIEESEEIILEVEEEFEEHVLERISSLEEAVRQLSQSLASAGELLGQVEHNLTVTHAGVQTLGGLLETHGVLTRAELADGWERSVGHEMLSKDLSRRFRQRAPRILALAAHVGQATPEFRRRLDAVELALLSSPQGMGRELLADLARMAPNNDELWSFIGEVAFETSDLESARVAFRKVIDLRGEHYETLIYLGTVEADLGRWTEADATLDKAQQMSPESSLPRFTRGALAAMQGDYEGAVPHLEKSLRREKMAQAYYLLGVSQLGLDHSGRAIDALRSALEMEPEFEEALYLLGTAYLRRGWSKLALDTFRSVLRLDPQRLQYQETVRLLSLKPPADLEPEVAGLVAKAEDELEQGRGDKALVIFSAAVVAAPNELSLQATAALLASSLGRTREAIGHAHNLLRSNPKNSPFLAAGVVALLESLRHSGRPRAARRIARRLYSAGEDGLTKGMAAYELALAESELGENLDVARDLAREALEITPRELQNYPLEALGVIALEQSRFREAVMYLEQAATAAPRPALLRQLAVARLGAGDREGAQAAIEAAEEQPQVGLDQELLGHVRRLGALLAEVNDRKSRGR